MTVEARRALLQASGYDVRFRELEWVECLISREEEAWFGRGRDRASALEAALRVAFPSHLARRLFERELERQAMSATMDAGHEAVALLSVDRAASSGGASSLAPPSAIAHMSSVAIGELLEPMIAGASSGIASGLSNGLPNGLPNGLSNGLPNGLSSGLTGDRSNGDGARGDFDERTLGETRDEPRDDRALQAALTVQRSLPARAPLTRSHSSPPPLVRRDATVPPRMDPPRAMEELEILMDRIRDSREELGLCSPERQRLAMLAWICEARAHTDTFPDDIRIRDRVGSISRQLTEIGKTFWPGSVTALQLQMQPRDLPRHVLGGPASTWARAAELAERALRSLEYTDERRGWDAYGWADAQHTMPAPDDPQTLLDRLSNDVEKSGGALAHHAVPREIDVRPEPDEFKRWVRTLRWLRCSDVDPDRWARIAGRLRWWACQRDVPLSSASRELDAGFAPEHSWAKELGVEAAPGADAARQSDPPSGSARPVSEHLLENIRNAMSGKRMVFVSNRRDPDLQTRLKDALPSATLDWRVAEPKRLEALGEAIQQGAYDVVLGAIGFQSQGTDHLLARACRLAGVKYIRVNRGRPMACLRALARDLHSVA